MGIQSDYAEPVKAQTDSALASAEELYRKTRSRFLRERIAYQMIRLCLYGHKYAYGEKIYKKYFLKNTNRGSWLYGTAMYYRTMLADTLHKKRYYQLSKVFDVSTNKRAAALYYFPSLGIDSILPLAKNNHERAIMYTMRELQYNGRSLKNLENIYRLDPGNKELTFLITREIGKLEDWMKTPEFTGYDFGPATQKEDWEDAYWERRWNNNNSFEKLLEKNRKKDKRYAAALHGFIDKVLKGKKQKDKNTLHLCAAHISLLQGEYDDAKKHMAAIQTQNISAAMQQQVTVENLMINVAGSLVFEEKDQNAYIDILNTPDSLLAIENAAGFKNQLTLFIGRTVMQHKDTAQGILLLAHTNRAIGLSNIPNWGYADALSYLPTIGSPVVYDHIIGILQKNNKTRYEQFLTQKTIREPWDDYDLTPQPPDSIAQQYGHVWSPEILLDMKATYYINRDELEKAVEIMKPIPASFWQKHPYVDYMTGDPFYTKAAKSIPDPYHILRPTGVKAISKPEYLDQIIYLKQNIDSVQGDSKALIALRIAEAYYQMSYHGEYWMMNRTYWSTNEYAQANTAFDHMYYGCSKARDWYLKALGYAKNERTAAVAAALARHCDRIYLNNEAFAKRDDNSELEYIYSDRIIAWLTKKYPAHPYYDMIINECP